MRRVPISGVEHGRRWGLLTAFSRVAPRVVAPVRSPRRAVGGRGYSIVASAQALHDISLRRRCGELSDRLVERVPPGLRVDHAAVALVEHDREWPALEPLLAKPGIVGPRPRGRVIHRPMTQERARHRVETPDQMRAGESRVYPSALWLTPPQPPQCAGLSPCELSSSRTAVAPTRPPSTAAT